MQRAADRRRRRVDREHVRPRLRAVEAVDAVGLPPLAPCVLEALEASGAYRATSFDAPRPGGEEEAGDSLGDAVGLVDTGFGLAEDRATLDRLMLAIGPREREVLRLRFVEDMTQAEIGERIGVSQMQISRLIRQSLARLRAAAETERKR